MSRRRRRWGFPRQRPNVIGRMPARGCIARFRGNGRVDLLGMEKYQASKLLAFASASSSFETSLPPPRALSGLPPPLPPTIGAIAWMIFPAWLLDVNSGETAATSETAPPDEPPSTTTPLNWLFNASAMV